MQGTIFEQMFTGGRGGFGGGRVRPRPIVRTAMRVSFEEAVKGTSKMVDLSSLGIPGIGKKTVEIIIPAGGLKQPACLINTIPVGTPDPHVCPLVHAVT